MSEQPIKVRCGDCRSFVRDGKCDFFQTPEGQDKERPFAHAPFWVWSDCYSDKEQVRFDVHTLCPTFQAKPVQAVLSCPLKMQKPTSGTIWRRLTVLTGRGFAATW